MTTFTETKVLQSLEIFPALNVINTRYKVTTLKDGVKFNEQVEAKSYSTSQFSDFEIEVAPTGGTLAEIVAGFSEAALTAASELPATLAAKQTELDTALATAQAAHAAELAAVQAEMNAERTAVQAALAAKDAEIAALEVQVVALTPAPSVPSVVASPRQIRQALTAAGMRAAVEDAVAAGDQDIKDWWNFSTAFERTNPQVTAMATALGVSDEELDGLWALAVTL